MRPRILFVSETVSLSQITRLSVLAKSLDPQRYDVHFAATAFPAVVDLPFVRWPIWGIDAKTAQARVAKGQRLFTRRMLRQAIAADAAVIEQVRPDVIVGDLRWSLAVSAPRAGVPLVTLMNAYWSPHARRSGFPLPDHPMVRWLGEKMAAEYFPKALPWVFRYFAAPLNRERQAAGLPPIGDLLEVLGYGDHVLFADPPELVSLVNQPANHHFLGYLPWSAPGGIPAAFGRGEKPAIYVTLGSSGDARCVAAVLAGLADLPVDVLLASAGRDVPGSLPANVVAMDYVDGDAACARANLVIHNGGSSTGYQALAAGTPVLGLPSNLDQHLASERISATGAGLHLRAGGLKSALVRSAVSRLLHEPSFAESAWSLRSVFHRTDALANFRNFMDRVCSATPAARWLRSA